MTTQTIDIAQLAGELAQIQSQRKELEEREHSIKAQLRSVGVGKHEAGPYTVAVSENKRLDEAKLKATYPIPDWPHFYIQKPNTKIIQGSIAPTLYQALMSPVGDPIVKVS